MIKPKHLHIVLVAADGEEYEYRDHNETENEEENEQMSAAAVEPTDTETSTRTRASGIARVASLLRKAKEDINTSLELLNRWKADAEKPEEIIDLMVPEFIPLHEKLDTVIAGADDLVKQGWTPPKAKVRALADGEKVKLRTESADRYTKSGIKPEDVMTVFGEGPARGTLWVDLANGMRLMVPKADIIRV